MFSMAMWMAALVAPIQILAGDQHGLNTLEHQPAKIMAMEGHFQSHPDGAPLILFGLPDSAEATRRLRGRRSRKLGSLILKHDLRRAASPGLDTVPRERLAAGRRSCSGRSGSWSGSASLMFAARPAGASSRAGAARSTTGRWLHRFALVDGAGRLRRGASPAG